MKITRICCYCKKFLGTIDAGQGVYPSLKISHGACEGCFKAEKEKLRRFKRLGFFNY